MFFLGNAETLLLGEVRLFVEEGHDDHGRRRGELLHGEPLAVVGHESEVEDFVPAWHPPFVGMCPLDHGVLLVVLDLHLYVGLHLRRVVDLTLRPCDAALPSCLVLDLGGLILVAWPSHARRHGSWSIVKTTSLQLRLVLLGALVAHPPVLFDDVVPQGNIFSLDAVNEDFALLLVLERHCGLGLDDRLELSACDEQLVEGCKYVALIVIKELHLADNALVARRLTFALSFLLSLSLLDLVKYPLATKQCILVDTLLEDKVWILDPLVFFFSWLFCALLQMDEVSFVSVELF